MKSWGGSFWRIAGRLRRDGRNGLRGDRVILIIDQWVGRGRWRRPGRLRHVLPLRVAVLRTDQAKRLKEQEKQIARLKQVVANQALDMEILREAASGNF